MGKLEFRIFYFVTFALFVVETLLTFGCGFAALGSLRLDLSYFVFFVPSWLKFASWLRLRRVRRSVYPVAQNTSNVSAKSRHDSAPKAMDPSSCDGVYFFLYKLSM